MPSIKQTFRTMRQQRRWRRATLPWGELDAEAARQGCSAADIFFDRAGRPVPGLVAALEARSASRSPWPATGACRLKPTRRPAVER